MLGLILIVAILQSDFVYSSDGYIVIKHKEISDLLSGWLAFNRRGGELIINSEKRYNSLVRRVTSRPEFKNSSWYKAEFMPNLDQIPTQVGSQVKIQTCSRYLRGTHMGYVLRLWPDPDIRLLLPTTPNSSCSSWPTISSSSSTTTHLLRIFIPVTYIRPPQKDVE